MSGRTAARAAVVGLLAAVAVVVSAKPAMACSCAAPSEPPPYSFTGVVTEDLGERSTGPGDVDLLHTYLVRVDDGRRGVHDDAVVTISLQPADVDMGGGSFVVNGCGLGRLLEGERYDIEAVALTNMISCGTQISGGDFAPPPLMPGDGGEGRWLIAATSSASLVALAGVGAWLVRRRRQDV